MKMTIASDNMLLELGFKNQYKPYPDNREETWYLYDFNIWLHSNHISYQKYDMPIIHKECSSINDIKLFIEFIKFIYYPETIDNSNNIEELLEKKQFEWIQNKLEQMHERYMEAENFILSMPKKIKWYNVSSLKDDVIQFITSRTKYKF